MVKTIKTERGPTTQSGGKLFGRIYCDRDGDIRCD